MATGSGAYVIHTKLAENIPGYCLLPFHPCRTLIPPSLPLLLRRSGKADIIHTSPDHAVFFAQKNIPLVITFHNYVLDAFMQPYSSFLQKLYYKSYLQPAHTSGVKKARTITAVSKFTAELAQKELKIEKEIIVIPNGIDEQIFYPSVKSKTNRKVQVLFSGNPTIRKGAQWLEHIADQLEDHIEIVVTGGLRNIKFFSSNTNSPIRTIGNVNHSNMPKLYNQVDMLLLPTVREGHSLSVLEAMACGLPVVASNCSSLAEQIIERKGGYLCPIGDTRCFAERINGLAASVTLRHEMGTFNRARIEERFTLKTMVQKYRDIFTHIYNTPVN